jgi:hypothetical protein
MLLMQLLEPRLFVELGTHYGDSYCAFCQSAVTLPIPPRCVAVDTWEGDEHAGFYEDDIYTSLSLHHDGRYGTFSQLLRTTFDDAAIEFNDGTIDLLHIDGLHTYEAVKHDFETYLPKCSERSIVLLHDTAVQERGFGVHQFWEELKASGRPAFEFVHAGGLGVVAVGPVVPERIQWLFALHAQDKDNVRELFEFLGDRWTLQGDVRKLERERDWTREKLAEVQAYAATLEDHQKASEVHRHDLQHYLEEVDTDRQKIREAHEQTLDRLKRIERSTTFRILSRLNGRG